MGIFYIVIDIIDLESHVVGGLNGEIAVYQRQSPWRLLDF